MFAHHLLDCGLNCRLETRYDEGTEDSRLAIDRNLFTRNKRLDRLQGRIGIEPCNRVRGKDG